MDKVYNILKSVQEKILLLKDEIVLKEIYETKLFCRNYYIKCKPESLF